jgi:hypothetical protein
MKGLRFYQVLFFALFSLQFFSSGAAPLSGFIRENNLQGKRVLLLLLNVNDCVKCKAATSLLHDSLRKQDNYYFLLYGIKSKNKEHYVKDILKLSTENTHLVVNDSLFKVLSPESHSLMVVTVGESLYYSKKMENVRYKFFHDEITVMLRPKDSTVLEENLEIVDGGNAFSANLSESNFMLYDRPMRNLIQYGKDGHQIRKVGPEFDDFEGVDSTFLKYIYYTYYPGRVNWDTVSTHIYYVRQYVQTVPMNILGAYNTDEKNTYLMTDFLLPVWDTIRADDGTYKRTRNTNYVRKTFITKYDTGMKLIKEYLISPSEYQDDFYMLPEFAVVNDTLYRNVRKKGNGGIASAPLLITYYLDDKKGSYIPAQAFGRLPDFFSKFEVATDARLYYDEAIGNIVALFIENNYIYEPKTNITWSLPGVPVFLDSIAYNKGQHFRNVHYFNSYSGGADSREAPAFTESKVPLRNFVYWYQNKLYAVQTDHKGQLKHRWNLLDHDLPIDVTCFNDNSYLYVVSSGEEDVVVYKFPLEKFR